MEIKDKDNQIKKLNNKIVELDNKIQELNRSIVLVSVSDLDMILRMVLNTLLK